jgi:tetratricopeptide (TPR) repeat protein
MASEDHSNLGPEAIRDATEALRLDPHNLKAHEVRAEHRTRLGDYKGAIEDLDAIIEFEPANADAYFRRGGCRALLEEFERAVEDYGYAIEFGPNPLYYTRRAELYERLGRRDKAEADRSAAAELQGI